MRAVDLIRKKRDGGEFTSDEIDRLIHGIASQEIADYQWSALLMAIVWRGMTDAETTALTHAMLHSGTIVDLSSIAGRKVDKHSTGGVGDKTSLVVAPVAAACGVVVPMVSGRGLGHTGGTLDKLESIPGFNVHLNLEQYTQVVREHGLVLIGQTDDIAPADRFLYALRDATATVESIPLITASILSKKLAEGIDGLVLDVKTGDGAFMRHEADARRLAESMCAIGRRMGKRVVALLTRMDQPLGYAVGNSVEVREAIECLCGNGPADLHMLSVELAAEMLILGERASTIEEARARCGDVIKNGKAIECFRALIAVQGGDEGVVDDSSRLPQAPIVAPIAASHAGYVKRIGAHAIGLATMHLGAGRTRVNAPIDHAVGIVLRKKVGDAVAAGERLCDVHARESRDVDRISAQLQAAYTISDEAPAALPIVIERL